jgi:hypothetical protein
LSHEIRDLLSLIEDIEHTNSEWHTLKLAVFYFVSSFKIEIQLSIILFLAFCFILMAFSLSLSLSFSFSLTLFVTHIFVVVEDVVFW